MLVQEFNTYLQEQVDNGSIYAWGGNGQIATVKTITALEKNLINRARVLYLYNKRKAKFPDMKLYDCSGIGNHWEHDIKGLVDSDKNANAMLKMCERLSKTDLKKGDRVFRVYTGAKDNGEAYHIGYVVDDELHVIEAMGRDKAVVKRTLNASGASYWNAFGRPLLFKSEIEAVKPKPKTFILKRELKYGAKGEDVKELQKLLAKENFSPGSIDGEFGKNTKAAVIAFQKKYHLEHDGVVGAITAASLGIIYKG